MKRIAKQRQPLSVRSLNTEELQAHRVAGGYGTWVRYGFDALEDADGNILKTISYTDMLVP